MSRFREYVLAASGRKSTHGRDGDRCRWLQIAALGALSMSSTQVLAASRPWALQDSVAFRSIALEPDAPTVRYLSGRQVEQRSVVPSPDGEYFFFVSSWGDLESDTDVAALSVYRSRSIVEWLQKRPMESLAPLWSAVFRSRSDQAPLTQPTWNVESTAIVFNAVSPDQAANAFRLDVISGELKQLTGASLSSGHTIRWATAQGEGVLYEESAAEAPPVTPYPAEWVGRRRDGTFVRGAQNETEKKQRYVSYGRQPPRPLALDSDSYLDPAIVRLSPDGSRAIGMTQQWVWESKTSDKEKTVGAIEKVDASAGKRPLLNFVLIDLKSAAISEIQGVEGSFREHRGAPAVHPTRPAVYWSEDGSRAILVSVTVDKSEPGIFEYETASGRLRVLEPFLQQLTGGARQYVGEVAWLKHNRELLVRHEIDGTPSEGTLYTLTASGVQRRSVAATEAAPKLGLALAGGLEARVTQSANDPPQVIVSLGGRKAVLTGPDPALKGVLVHRSEPFSWREPNGQTQTAVLTLPEKAYNSGPVPLVIHAYISRPDQFLPDGAHRAADAAQVLASRGIAALQMEIPLPSDEVKEEGPRFVARVDSVVAELARQGIVDSNKVGLTGFSRGGFQVFYAITHPKNTHFAAAMGEDFFTGSYAEYVEGNTTIPRPAVAWNFERAVGGSFWERRAEWLEYESTFNVDRSVTPFLLTSHVLKDDADVVSLRRDPPAVMAVVGAFVRNDKPIDYIYMGYSEHPLSRPLERLTEMSAMADWMAFWLQGYEDPSPHKAQIYQRWRPLRAQQEKSLERAQSPSRGLSAR